MIGSAIGLAAMVAIAASTTSAAQHGGDAIANLNDGFHQAFFWSGITAFTGALIALLFVRSSGSKRHAAQ